MLYKRPIITSDKDFSRWICKENAFYFDPNNPHSIANAIEEYINNDHLGFDRGEVNLNLPRPYQIQGDHYLCIPQLH